MWVRGRGWGRRKRDAGDGAMERRRLYVVPQAGGLKRGPWRWPWLVSCPHLPLSYLVELRCSASINPIHPSPRYLPLDCFLASSCASRCPTRELGSYVVPSPVSWILANLRGFFATSTQLCPSLHSIRSLRPVMAKTQAPKQKTLPSLQLSGGSSLRQPMATAGGDLFPAPAGKSV